MDLQFKTILKRAVRRGEERSLGILVLFITTMRDLFYVFSSSYRGSPSRYNQDNAHAPARSQRIVVTQPRRSVFRDAAAVAGGVTVGTTMVITLYKSTFRPSTWAGSKPEGKTFRIIPIGTTKKGTDIQYSTNLP